MKRLSFFILLFVTTSCIAQGEANIWYFGEHAGLDFSSGTPVALTNGQIDTDEGCGVISNAAGELLFYTDGITVYNKNHAIMQNGNGLLGHPSAMQSATIVPKPGSLNLYYVFTTAAELGEAGFRYTIVDMNLENGLGAVTNEKNILIETPTLECIGITKHANGVDYWIVTHGWASNNFFVYQLTSSGLSAEPTVQSIGNVVNGSVTDFAAAGMIKFAPSGAKMAITSTSDFAQLYDFDNATGIISNTITLTTETGELCGAAFSPNESLLYISNSSGNLYQFDLNAENIPASKLTLYNGTLWNSIGQLQVGPDQKIYVAFNNRTKLSVIESPNTLGVACNFVIDAIDLNGKRSKLGLPSFNQSWFYLPAIQIDVSCAGEVSTFSVNTGQQVLSANWNFGDGNTASGVNPTHTYLAAGQYTVTVEITTPFGSGVRSREILISTKPQLTNQKITISQCDLDGDGFTFFNLTDTTFLPVVSTVGLTWKYFTTFENAATNSDAITNLIAFPNQTSIGNQLFLRLQNATGCFEIITVALSISIPSPTLDLDKTIEVCDDLESGSASDGISSFNLINAVTQFQTLLNQKDNLLISFYLTENEALAKLNSITVLEPFVNLNSINEQQLFVRIESQQNGICLAVGSYLTLRVLQTPLIVNKTLFECDTDLDGFASFDTTSLENELAQGQDQLVFSYFESNGAALSSPLPNPYNTDSKTITVRATSSISGCFTEALLDFSVVQRPIANPISPNLLTGCDDEIISSEQDGIFSFDTSSFDSLIVGTQTNVGVRYFDSSGVQLITPLPNPFTTNSKQIFAEVYNLSFDNCRSTIPLDFKVLERPRLALDSSKLICTDENSEIGINAGILSGQQANDFDYQWYRDGSVLSNETLEFLDVSTAGIYTVEVKNQRNCTSTRKFMIYTSESASNVAVEVRDLRENNSIIISAEGSGNYEYSIDGVTFQSSNTFENVPFGVYNLLIRDVNGCASISKLVEVLGLPKFFTPNGDGYNDFWNVEGLNRFERTNVKLFVYNRYGALLSEVDVHGDGWDGNYNGNPLPSDDYWYLIKHEAGTVSNGHFSLRR